jgi:mannose-6-phosphate isomerase-like protein (cupin superfamily)
MSNIFYDNIEKSTINNNNYRNIQYTHPGGMQFVLMSIKYGEEIGMEVHDNHDQFFRVEKGKGILEIKKSNKITKYDLYDGVGIIIPSGTYHNVINTGKEPLKMYSIYTPPEHKQGLIQKEKPNEQAGGDKTYYKFNNFIIK